MSIVTKARRKELLNDQRFLDIIKNDRLDSPEYINGECQQLAAGDVEEHDNSYGEFCIAYEAVISVVLYMLEKNELPSQITDWLKQVINNPGPTPFLETDNPFFFQFKYFISDENSLPPMFGGDCICGQYDEVTEQFTSWSDEFRRYVAEIHRGIRRDMQDDAEQDYSCMVMSTITDNDWLRDHAEEFLKRDETPFMRNIITEYEAAA